MPADPDLCPASFHRQLVVPFTMTPIEVLVTSLFHAMDPYRLHRNFRGLTRFVPHRNDTAPGPAGTGKIVQLMPHLPMPNPGLPLQYRPIPE